MTKVFILHIEFPIKCMSEFNVLIAVAEKLSFRRVVLALEGAPSTRG